MFDAVKRLFGKSPESNAHQLLCFIDDLEGALRRARTRPGEVDGGLRELKFLAHDIKKRKGELSANQWKLARMKIESNIGHFRLIHKSQRAPKGWVDQELKRMVEAAEKLEESIDQKVIAVDFQKKRERRLGG